MDRAKRQIIQLLSVLFAGLLTAVLALLFMVYSWSPTGAYAAKNAILSPDVMNQLNGKKSRFIFDHVEYSFYNGKEWINQVVKREAFNKFYHLVQNDKSSEGDQAEKLFHSSLVIFVREAKEGVALPFQEISIGTDHYRVELHEESPKERFAYFYHPQIKEKAEALFQ